MTTAVREDSQEELKVDTEKPGLNGAFEIV